MSAKKTGGSAGRIRAKDQAMAAAMKAQGVTRNIARCPICNNIVGIDRLPQHIASCKGS